MVNCFESLKQFNISRRKNDRGNKNTKRAQQWFENFFILPSSFPAFLAMLSVLNEIKTS